MYLSDWSGVSFHDEGLEIKEVMETPAPGDLLLLSVNTIHATQTTGAWRCRCARAIRRRRSTGIGWPESYASLVEYVGDMTGRRPPNKLFTRFRATQENDFGITLADILPTLTGEQE